MTGNLQNISYGFLYAKDEKLTDGGYVYNDGDQYIVANIKPKGDNWSFQISTLNRFNPSKGYNNSILQLSPMIYLTKSNRLMIDAYLSTRKEKNEASLNGLDYCVNYSHYAKKYTFDSYLYSTSKNFIADMGITNETGYSMLSYAYHYRFYTSQLRFLGFDNSCDYSFFNENGKMSYLYAKSSLSGSTMSGYSFKSIIKFIQDDFEGKIFTNPEIFQQFGWNNYKNIVITASVSFAHPLIYSLKDAYKLISYNASGNYTFMDRYKLAISWTLMNYLGLSTNEKETFDNNYQFLNGDVTLNIAKKLKSTTGIRYNNYNVHRFYGDTEYHYTDHLGVYANLLFKFNKYIELSGGYSYGADIINERTDESHNNFWSKLMVEYSF